jgi:Zn-dependent M28 family amino/carboxypeptidase
VAVLLEAARVLRANPSDVGVDIVLFDLEDMGDEGAERDPHNRDPFCIGSERFLADNPSYRPAFGILVDMVGDRALRIPKEGFSVQHAPHVVEMVWRAARRVGASAFVEERGGAILDDHVPFLKRGIPVVDLIDFDYPHWHTTGDTPDRCAPESLQQVGDVLLRVIRDHGQR